MHADEFYESRLSEQDIDSHEVHRASPLIIPFGVLPPRIKNVSSRDTACRFEQVRISLSRID